MERERLTEFVRCDYPRVVAALAFACGDTGRAEDAVQEALVTACEHRGQIVNLREWVAKTALNKARTKVRRLGAEHRAYERARDMRRAPSETEDRRLDDTVTEELRQLPARQREIVVLHYLLDMSVVDVADALGVAEGTVKTQLHRARGTLRTRLSGEPRIEEEADHVG